MGRVLYFHHYFPALMFSIMLAGRYMLHTIPLPLTVNHITIVMNNMYIIGLCEIYAKCKLFCVKVCNDCYYFAAFSVFYSIVVTDIEALLL